MTLERDMRLLARTARRILPSSIDGRRAVQEMKAGNCRNWRQMEWIGFYLEHLFMGARGIKEGPEFGKTRFDLLLSGVWDLKAHVANRKGSRMHEVILNDAEATEECIRCFGRIDYFLVSGDAVFDEDDAFRKWHDEFKGGESNYTKNRKKRGAKPRLRKSHFLPKQALFFGFDSVDQLTAATEEGWVKPFQTGMRNADGSPRRRKYKVRVDRLPSAVLHEKVKLHQ